MKPRMVKAGVSIAALSAVTMLSPSSSSALELDVMSRVDAVTAGLSQALGHTLFAGEDLSTWAPCATEIVEASIEELPDAGDVTLHDANAVRSASRALAQLDETDRGGGSAKARR